MVGTKNIEEKHPRFWRLRRLARKGGYWLRRFPLAVIRWRPLAIVGPLVTGGYLAALDVWGDKWGWTDKHAEINSVLFVVAIAAPMLVLFLRGLVGDPQPLDSSDVAREVLSDFLTTVGAIVAAKTLRFRNAIPSIRPNSDRFLHITDPKSQIHIISNAVVGFICRNYGLAEDQVDITIIRRKPGGAWHFHYMHHATWKHTEPPRLMGDTSAAASCLASGEPEFHPDKIEAAGQQKYFLSRRDKRRGDGSVFVYPVSVAVPAGSVDCVVSIVTYGKQLCQDHESQTKAITKSLLSEICRRYELELCLDAIKSDSKAKEKSKPCPTKEAEE